MSAAAGMRPEEGKGRCTLCTRAVGLAEAVEGEQGIFCPSCLANLGGVLWGNGSAELPTPVPEAETATAHDVSRQRGPYVLLEPIGSGGMGVVWLAAHRGTDRLVAVKVPLLDRMEDERLLTLFVREARVLSLLDHPHILPIYEVGDDARSPWFAMRLAHGGTLAEAVAREGAWAANDAAALAARLASALQHAHGNGILHLDLKPSNVLLDELHTPLLADFGVARDSSRRSVPMNGLGTPGYAAPELLQRAEAITPAVDIFSLGATLLFLLLGRDPLIQSDLEIGRKTCWMMPRRGNLRDEAGIPELDPVAALTPAVDLAALTVASAKACCEGLRGVGVDADLRRICRKCIQLDPLDRYPTAAALEQDLRAWLEGRPISTNAHSPWARASRWIRRRPRLSLSVLLIGGVLVAALSLGWISQRRLTMSERARAAAAWELANAQRREAESQAALVTELRFEAELETQQLLLSQRTATARREVLEWIRRNWPGHRGAELRSLAIQALSLAVASSLPANGTGPKITVWPTSALDGHWPSPRGGAWVRADAGKQVTEFGFGERTHRLPQNFTALSWSPDGLRLACASSDKQLFLWNLDDKAPQAQIRRLDSQVGELLWHPYQPWVAAVDWAGELLLWDWQRQSILLTAQAGIAPRSGLAWDADGLGLSWLDEAGQSRILRLEPAAFPYQWRSAGGGGKREIFSAIALDAQRQRGLWSLADGVYCWDWGRAAPRLVAARSRDEWLGSAWRAGDAWFCGWTSGLRRIPASDLGVAVAAPQLVRAESGLVLQRQRYGDGADQFNFGFLNGAAGQFVLRRLPDEAQGQLLLPMTKPFDLALSADGLRAATSSFADGTICLWALPSGELRQRWETPGRAPRLDFSADSQTLAIVLADGLILQNLDQPQLANKQVFPHGLHGVAWMEQDDLLALCGEAQVQLVRRTDGREVATLSDPDPRPGNPLVAMESDEAGRFLATQSDDGTLTVWDLQLLGRELEALGLGW